MNKINCPKTDESDHGDGNGANGTECSLLEFVRDEADNYDPDRAIKIRRNSI